MNRVYQVLVTYTTRRLHMLILFVITVSGVVMIYAANAGDRGSGSSDMGLITFLLFPMVMLNQYLGAFLKHQMATYRAALVPGYRTPHLIAAALVVLFPLLVCTVTATVRSLPLPGIIGILAFAAMAGLHGGNSSQLVAWSCYAFLIATFFVPHLRAAIFEMLNGQEPGMAWSLISASVAGTALLFHRLATLTEDDPEFGRVMPMDPWDRSAFASRTRNRSLFHQRPTFISLMTGAASLRLDSITTKPARTMWQRVALLRLADDAPMNIGWFVFATTTAVFMITLMLYSHGTRLQAFALLLSLATAVVWIAQLGATASRWSRLGYESLRPQTRRQWVIENGLSIIISGMLLQSSILPLSVNLAILLFGKSLSPELIGCGLLLILSRHILIFGLWFWVASFRSTFLSAIAGFGLVLILTPSSITFPYPSFGWWTTQSLLILSGIVSVAGIALCWMAYRRWCRIDLA